MSKAAWRLALVLALAMALAPLAYAQLPFDPLAPGNLFPKRTMAEKFANPLPRGLSPEEREYLLRHFDKYLASKYEGVNPSLTAPEPVIGAAEFDPADGAIFAWQGYTSLLTELIVFVTQTDRAYIGVDRQSDIASAKSTLVQAGAKEENLVWVVKYLDSVWMRDYGPFFSYTKGGDRRVIDLKYNRPRPNDDQFPPALAKQLNLPCDTIGLILAGGNLCMDGHGVAFMTDVIFDPSQGGDPNLTPAKLQAFMRDYLGCKKVVILEDMADDGTGHCDMYSKLLNDDTFIVGKYAKPSDGASGNAALLDRQAARLEKETNGKGQPFKVFRIPMPPRQSGTSYTYTNSLICNHKVLVPVYGFSTDEEALEIYRRALPGYEVKGFDCNDIIGANGAIHCITQLVMSDPLELNHEQPMSVPAGKAVTLGVGVKSADLPAKVELCFKVGEGEVQTQPCTLGEQPGRYVVQLPPLEEGAQVSYWFRAELDDFMADTYPKGAPEAGAAKLTVGPAEQPPAR